MYIVYGIPNCDTVKKALLWMQKNKIPFTFYDYKKEGVSIPKLKLWSKQVGWENLINKKGTTWRQTEPTIQISIAHYLPKTECMKYQPHLRKFRTSRQ